MKQSDKQGWKMIIMAGLPASGKSSYRQAHFFDLKVIDCDEIKKSLPGYDPKNPEIVHALSKAIEKKDLYETLASGDSFVYDTTASNSDKIISLIHEAHDLGYTVEIVYIKVSLFTALYRNARRERVVPESTIFEKFQTLEGSLSILQHFADQFTQIEND